MLISHVCAFVVKKFVKCSIVDFRLMVDSSSSSFKSQHDHMRTLATVHRAKHVIADFSDIWRRRKVKLKTTQECYFFFLSPSEIIRRRQILSSLTCSVIYDKVASSKFIILTNSVSSHFSLLDINISELGSLALSARTSKRRLKRWVLMS